MYCNKVLMLIFNIIYDMKTAIFKDMEMAF